MHPYYNPNISDFSRCYKPMWFVYADDTHVHAYCEDGHHIVSHIYPSREQAHKVVIRARHSILCNKFPT